RHPHAPRHRLGDRPQIGIEPRPIALCELELVPLPIPHPNLLIARLPIEPIAPQKRMKPPPPLLEEVEHGAHVVTRLDPIPSFKPPPRMRPPAVALLAPRRQRNHIGRPHRPTLRSQRNIERKPHLMKCHDCSLCFSMRWPRLPLLPLREKVGRRSRIG